MALRLNPTDSPRREATPPISESVNAMAVEASSIYGPDSDTASAPLTTMIEMRATKRKLIGTREIPSEGRLRLPKILCLFNLINPLK